MGSVEPTEDAIATFLAEGGEGPVVMINLLRYRDAARYPDDFAAEPCTGREAYRRYGAVAAQRIASVGGRLLWMGEVRGTLIAPANERWDDAVLVEYPSRKAFVEMVSQPEYLAVAPHRTAALEDSRLVATRTVVDALGR